MAKPKNEAFIDLEQSLCSRLDRAWGQQLNPITKKIVKHVRKGEWQDAHDLADTLDYADIADKSDKMFRTIGMAAVLLGVSRITTTKRSLLVKNLPQELIENASLQIHVILAQNADTAVKREAHVLISREEQAQKERDEQVEKRETENFVKNFAGKLATSGAGYNQVAASMHVSRLNSLGFLGEANARGRRFYVVSEVLDLSTCPVCRTMHGRKFPVPEGLAHVTNILSLSDPSAMSSIAPWPGQSRPAVSKLKKMSQQEMMNGGLSLPPYHPNCRGIVTVTGAVPSLTAAATSLAAGMSIVGIHDDSEQITNRLFGDLSDLDLAAAAAIGVGQIESEVEEDDVIGL